jgi:uncharacterized SAM-binding protein YcdF (DUF218 family)
MVWLLIVESVMAYWFNIEHARVLGAKRAASAARQPPTTLLVLAFDIEKSGSTASGYEPAEYQLTEWGSIPLFSKIRLEATAAAYHLGIAKQAVIFGGVEKRYQPAESIGRADAIRQMLIHDYDVSPDWVASVTTKPNTQGNIESIRSWRGRRPWNSLNALTNHYHIPRASRPFSTAGIPLVFHAAEEILLLTAEGGDERKILRSKLGEDFGQDLAWRSVMEANGMADEKLKAYTPQTV